jgi:hypothetical protein
MPPQSVFRCNNALYSVHAIPFYSVSRAFLYWYSPFVVSINNTETHGRNVVDIVATTYERRGQKRVEEGVLSFRKSCCWFTSNATSVVKRRGINTQLPLVYKKKKRQGGYFVKQQIEEVCVIVLLHIFNQLRWSLYTRLMWCQHLSLFFL